MLSLRLKGLLILDHKPSCSMVITVGADALGAASLADLCDEPGEPVGSFTGVDTGAGSAVEDSAPILKEEASHSDSAARNFPGDSVRRKRTKVEPSLKLNSKPSFNEREDTTNILQANHILETNVAAKAVTQTIL